MLPFLSGVFVFCLWSGVALTAIFRDTCLTPVNHLGDGVIFISKSETIRQASQQITSNTDFSDRDFLVLAFATVKKLGQKGVIKGPYELQSGEFYLNPGIRVAHIIKKIVSGDILYRRIQIPSGLTKDEIIPIIDGADGLVGEIACEIPEGEMMPQTYFYKRGDTRQGLVLRILKQNHEVLEGFWRLRDQNLPYKNAKEALIMASIIEREAISKEDKKMVASVFLNRMKIGMKLQSDPTVQYMIDLEALSKNAPKRGLTTVDFFKNSPLSTYSVTGLPISPICNPDINSLIAAFSPAKTNFYYFISLPNVVKLIFAETYKEHLVNVKKLAQAREEEASKKPIGS